MQSTGGRKMQEPGRPRSHTDPPDHVADGYSWNVTTTPVAMPANLAERNAELWTSPQGFVRAARANAAVVTPASGGNARVSFPLDRVYRYEGPLNAAGDVLRVRTFLDCDARTPWATPPATPSPLWTNLHENIQRLGLGVRRIAPLQGALQTIDDLRAALALGCLLAVAVRLPAVGSKPSGSTNEIVSPATGTRAASRNGCALVSFERTCPPGPCLEIVFASSASSQESADWRLACVSRATNRSSCAKSTRERAASWPHTSRRLDSIVMCGP